MPPVPLDTSTTALVCIFSSILNSMMERWKYRSRELLKTIFCHQKKQESRYFLEICMKFFLDICMKCLNPQFRINKLVNEHTVDYHPSPSELTSRIHPMKFLWTPKWFIFLQYVSGIFYQTCISHHGSGKVSNSWC